MSMKPKIQDKNNKMSEIDDKILKNFDIKKVCNFFKNYIHVHVHEIAIKYQ